MKIIYKIFIFALILRLVPLIVLATGVFPNYALEDLGYDFDANSSPYDIIWEVVSPAGNDIILYEDAPFVGDITFAVTYTSIIAILLVVAFVRSTAIPTIVAGMSAMLIIPFIVDTGLIFMRGAESYHSNALTLMIITIIVGFVAVAILTIFEGAAQSQDASDT